MGFTEDDLRPCAWIACADHLPKEQDSVAFVVQSLNDYYNGRVFGGTYLGEGEFAVPGISFGATHWMLLPPAPVSALQEAKNS